LGICILGQYVVRIYDHVRGRPLYLVDRTVNIGPDADTCREDDVAGDRPYLDLANEAMQLLQAGSRAADSPAAQSACQSDAPWAAPVRQ
jgi:hypothetical protein